ncbi:alpha-methylacyl-CoA racemase isoform X1 [Anabrus simplex]|uniref:alpha-methylacyl-CoA racemase isoform X1 n=1 Tax=Anabrus simplex TaxID=316456 RepID=UPI0034DD6D7E
MALKGLQVIELAGLAPAPFCGMVLADFGASVIKIERAGDGGGGFERLDCLANGKKSLALNLKSPKGVQILRKLCSGSDVLIEPYRKGVMEKLGLGPNVLLSDNPRLVYARLTGFGQSGPFSEMAGHDINYLAMSGLLSLMGRKSDAPIAPLNLAADFGGGGLMCALGILMALLERHKSGKGQVIDASMVEGVAYLGSWLFRSQHLPFWGQPRGQNLLDTGTHFYETYETKDGKYLAVGALEPQFYLKLLEGLGLSESEVSQFGDHESKKNIFAKRFKEKTLKEWCEVFDMTDACVTPVLSVQEAHEHPHNVERQSFVQFSDSSYMVPKPAPQLSRTPGKSMASLPSPSVGQHTRDILRTLGFTPSEITNLEKEGIVKSVSDKAKL